MYKCTWTFNYFNYNDSTEGQIIENSICPVTNRAMYQADICMNQKAYGVYIYSFTLEWESSQF